MRLIYISIFLLVSNSALCEGSLELSQNIRIEYEKLSDKIVKEITNGNLSYFYEYSPVLGLVMDNPKEREELKLVLKEKVKELENHNKNINFKIENKNYVCGLTFNNTSIVLEDVKYSFVIDGESKIENEQQVYIYHQENWYVGKNESRTFNFFSKMNHSKTTGNEESLGHNECIKKLLF